MAEQTFLEYLLLFAKLTQGKRRVGCKINQEKVRVGRKFNQVGETISPKRLKMPTITIRNDQFYNRYAVVIATLNIKGGMSLLHGNFTVPVIVNAAYHFGEKVVEDCLISKFASLALDLFPISSHSLEEVSSRQHESTFPRIRQKGAFEEGDILFKASSI